MRLIDADWLQERLAKEPMENRTYLRANEIAAEAPTAYDVDKVVKELDGVMFLTTNDDGETDDLSIPVMEADEVIKIVKSGGIE